MRTGILLLTLFVALGCVTFRLVNSRPLSAGPQNFAALSFTSSATKPDFETQVKPIFVARCQPCHFQGGQVYESMPFDKPETITRLGEKLFTRIKNEKEQRLIREFLSKSAEK